MEEQIPADNGSDTLSKLRAGAWKHPEFAGTVALFVFVVLRAIIASNGNPAAALALVQSSGPLAVVVAAVTPLLYTALASFTAYALMRVVEDALDKHPLGHWGHIASYSILVSLFVVPRRSLLYGLGITLLLFLLLAWGRRKRREPPRWPISVIVVWVLQYVFLFNGTASWLPSEVVVSDGEPMIGYVLDDRDEWMTFMIEETRSLLYLKTSSVDSRGFCVTESPSSPLLSNLEHTEMPTCDDLVEAIAQKRGA